MAEELLHRLERRTPHDEVRREGVPEHVPPDSPDARVLARTPERPLRLGLLEEAAVSAREHELTLEMPVGAQAIDDDPDWGEDKIAEELVVKLGVRHSSSTIRKYRVRGRQPRGSQTWKTFTKNHAGQIFAVDFLTQTTAFFAVVYIRVARPGTDPRAKTTNASR